MSNRRIRHLTGRRLNAKQKPQVLREAKPWHSRVASPTYSEALSAMRRTDKAEAKARGVTYNRHFKRVLKRERLQRALDAR